MLLKVNFDNKLEKQILKFVEIVEYFSIKESVVRSKFVSLFLPYLYFLTLL